MTPSLARCIKCFTVSLAVGFPFSENMLVNKGVRSPRGSSSRRNNLKTIVMIMKFIKKLLAPIIREVLEEEIKKTYPQEVQETLLKVLKNASCVSL